MPEAITIAGRTRLRTPRGPKPEPAPLKKCKTCKQTLPLAEFVPRIKGAQGVSTRCRGCITAHYEAGTFGCGRCGRRDLPGAAFFRGASGSAVLQPCKECKSSAKAAATRLKHIERGREPYHLLSDIDAEARAATCRECGPVHIYATGQARGCGWRCGVRSDALNIAWQDAKGNAIDKHAAARWHRIRDVRGAEMRGTCSQCGDAAVRWNQTGGYFTCANPERRAQRAEVERKRRNLKLYGVSLEEYEEMYRAQGGVCAICGGGQTRADAALSVDHDHETGAVRGLLCNLCNTGIGAMRDSPEIMLAAIAYLQRSLAIQQAA